MKLKNHHSQLGMLSSEVKGTSMKNTLLRAARRQKAWSQQQLADFAGVSLSTVERAERGEPSRVDNIERLCACLQKTPEQLGLVHTEDQGVDRRQAIKTIGTAGASVVIASQGIGTEIDRLIARKLTRLQNWVVDSLEDGTHLRWQLYYTSRNSLTEVGLLSQIARLEQLADDGGDHYQHVCRILAQNYQLAGSLARDRFQYTKSLEYFQKAEQLHEDTQLSDLTAVAIARQGVALLRKDPERYLKKSLALYSSAADKAKRAEPYTQAYVLSRYAEALARKGSYDECIQSLDQAEVLLSRAANVPIEEDFAYVRLTLQSLADSRGECYVLLGKPEKGLEHLQAAQKRLNQKMSRNNCRLLMQQSEAYLAAGSLDASVQQALKGLEVARILESTSNIHWASEILAKLRSSAFSDEPVVDELYEAIRG
jgi:transcriptional regulator with XRE-family HTH domain